MCFIPPQCLFCQHLLMEDGDLDGPDCRAFDEIPSDIYRGMFDHSKAHPGDRGLRFRLRPEMAEEFYEINELRVKTGLGAYVVQTEPQLTTVVQHRSGNQHSTDHTTGRSQGHR